MIHFKCIYCGQRIAVNDDLASKNGKCPTCRHQLRIPIQTAPLTGVDTAERKKKATEEFFLTNINRAEVRRGDRDHHTPGMIRYRTLSA